METFSESVESLGSTSTSLLQRVRLRDADAWSRLVRLYGRLVLYWCRNAGLQRADRADVFQEVFRSVAAHIDSFRHDRQGDTFRGWLRAVTRSKIQDHFRSLRREPAGQGGSELHQQLQLVADHPLSDGESFDLPDDRSEKSLLMAQALEMVRQSFEERTWKAFWRTSVDGIATDMAAQELGMTSANVRQARSRVLRRLRDEFSGLVEEFSEN